MIGKISGISLALVIVVGLAGLATPLSPVLADDPVVTFPDARLEAAILMLIWRPSGHIYQSDLVRLKGFSASYEGISNLRGLEYCINLTTLDLSRNQISDISTLSSLTNLTTLNLDENRISDISPLSSLTNLTTLDLSRNRISDISSLSSLTNLTWLDLSDNRISDISPLSSLTNLTKLDLSRNQISDISPLSSFTNLTKLNLDENRISDISPLSSFTNLTKLDLSRNQISDISSLSSLTNLTWLHLSDNRISDISTLVDNIGLNEGDEVHLESNYLDLAPDSQARNDIQTLLDRGVNVYVYYEDYWQERPPLPLTGALLIMPLLMPVFVIGGLVSLFQFNPHIFIIVILGAAAIVGLVIFFVRTKRRHF